MDQEILCGDDFFLPGEDDDPFQFLAQSPDPLENFFIDGDFDLSTTNDPIFHGLESIKSTLHYTDDQILASAFEDTELEDLLTIAAQDFPISVASASSASSSSASSASSSSLSSSASVSKKRKTRSASESSAGKSKRRKRLPEKSVQVLREWFESKLPHPYATEPDEMQNLAVASGLTVTQVKNWIANHRKRVWLRQQRNK